MDEVQNALNIPKQASKISEILIFEWNLWNIKKIKSYEIKPKLHSV